MSLPFSITSTTRELDRAGYVYRAITTLDFHQGWFTRLMRTTRADNGYPKWTHGVCTQSLTDLEEWHSNCEARPIKKFETLELAEEWLEDYLRRTTTG